MRSNRLRVACVVALDLAWIVALGLWFSAYCGAAEPTEASKTKEEPSKTSSKAAEEKKKFPEWEKVVEGAKELEGLFPLYYNEKEQKLFMEIRQDQYDKELILPMAIARGAGLMYLGGETLNFGDQWLISFHRAADRILVIRRNVRFKAEAGSPQADAVKLSYTDSVIKALPIKSEKGGGHQVLVDLADLLMTDLAKIGINPDPTRSTWVKVKAFPKNVEIELSAVFTAGSRGLFSFFSGESVPDSRGTQVVIHYGLSMVPESSSYKPRLADDRVGHFLSLVKDFTKDTPDTADVRYVSRWHLEKESTAAKLSPPKQPIIFWIERTVPRAYRQYVRDGILEWNKAFEKVGYIDAIQVRDQQSEDEFDPEDIRYNTFRWITTSAGFAMGPSRTNPKTGEILDADIVFDEGMIRYWRQQYLETAGIPQGIALLLSGQRQGFYKLYAADLPAFEAAEPLLNRWLRENPALLPEVTQRASASPFPSYGEGMAAVCPNCQLGPGMQRQLGVLASVLAAKGELDPGGKVPEKYLAQAIKEVVMHEVGHTLGLRHNFKGSTAYTLKDINNPAFTSQKGNSGSVMDYLPANIAPKGEKQGDYFTPTIGPYDYWAIEYAYKPIEGSEKEELAKIASKAAAADLTYGTDEDMFLNPDPRINLYDLGDPLEYARNRIKLAQASMKDLQDRVVAKGEGWQRARHAFSVLLGELAMATRLSADYVGGEYTARDHRGDPNARPPMKPIDLAKQHEAIGLLKDEILSARAFQFKPELLRQLAPEHWEPTDFIMLLLSSDYQYPVLDRVLSIQRMVLSRFLDSKTLRSLQEAALQADAGEEVLQMPEVFDALTDAIWSELPKVSNDMKDGAKEAKEQAKKESSKIEISTIRRNLQREHVRQLARLVVGQHGGMRGFDLELLLFFDIGKPAPPDARSLARSHLRQINARVQQVLRTSKGASLDSYSRAHLEEIHDQIEKVLKASLQTNEL
jgi:hypothetical protein